MNNTMNRSELIQAVAEATGLSKKDATAAVNATFDTVAKTLTGGDKVQLVGFGTFEIRDRAARVAKNPRTGENVEIAACKIPAFKPGKALKESVNG